MFLPSIDKMEIPSLNLVAAGILFGIIQIFFLIYIFLSGKTKPGNYIFSLFLLTLLIIQTESFLNRSGYMPLFIHFMNVAIPFNFLLGPLLFLYTKSSSRLQITRSDYLHFLPFILYLGYSFFFFLQPGGYKLLAYARSFSPNLQVEQVQSLFETDPLDIQGIVVVELISVHILFYAILNIALLIKCDQKIGWLGFINGLLLVGGLILFFSQGGIINGERFFPSLLPQFSADLYPTIATYAITIYLIQSGIARILMPRKYYKSTITEEHRRGLLKRIRNTLEEEKLYLNNDFSLHTLAEACNLNKHQLSQILNEEMGSSFYDLTNSYRISEAKKILSESNGYIKMEQLAYDLGYKSKSTFFIAFKKATKQTPSQYRQTMPA